MRCSPEEYLVAKGDAVNGNGFLLTGDDEDVEEEDNARSRMVKEGIRGRGLVSCCNCREVSISLNGPPAVKVAADGKGRSDEPEA